MLETIKKIFYSSDEQIKILFQEKSQSFSGILIVDRLIYTILKFNDTPDIFDANESYIIRHNNFADTYQNVLNNAIFDGINKIRLMISGSSNISTEPSNFSLDGIFNISYSDMESFAMINGQKLSGDHIYDRLIVTILLYNRNRCEFNSVDRKIIENPDFSKVYHDIMKQAYDIGFENMMALLQFYSEAKEPTSWGKSRRDKQLHPPDKVDNITPETELKHDYRSTPGILIPPTIPQTGSTILQTEFIPQDTLGVSGLQATQAMAAIYKAPNPSIDVKSSKPSTSVQTSSCLRQPDEHSSSSKVLSGLMIAVSGTINGFTRKSFTDLVAKHGGSVASSITNSVNYLITTPAEVSKNTTKVKKANEKGVPMVTIDFIIDSIDKGQIQNIQHYSVV